MKTITREDWAAALRSGRFKQGVGVLYNVSDDTYCCLGVACEIAELPHDSIDFGWKSGPMGYIPQVIADMLGIPHHFDQRAFVIVNDIDKLTFSQIADMIDALPETAK